MVTRDNLVVHDCICWLEERAIVLFNATGWRGDDWGATELHWNWLAHYCVLVAKPTFNKLGTSTFLVRLGHTMESHRVSSLVEQFVETYVRSHFDYIFLESDDDIPDDYQGWAASARRIIVLTRPASKSTEEEEELLLAADTGCWGLERITH